MNKTYKIDKMLKWESKKHSDNINTSVHVTWQIDHDTMAV